MADSYEEAILSAVQSEIQSLNLEGISSSNIVIGKVPTDRKGLLADPPGILITSWGDAVEVGGTNVSDYIAYPVFIGIVQASNTDQQLGRNQALKWSAQISSKFRNQHLAGVETVITCRVKRNTKFDPTMFFSANVDVNTLLLSFENKEPRG